MLHPIVRRMLVLFTLAVSSTISFSQSATSLDIPVTHAAGAGNTWQVALSAGSHERKLFVVTLHEPNRRQTCHIQSFTPDKLVCSRAFGSLRTFLPQQVVALILPGDNDLKLRLVLGFNAGLGAAILGTVVLAATCPVCAGATGIAALFFFGAAGATLIGDDQPDRLIYLAPGQHLSRKLGFVQS